MATAAVQSNDVEDEAPADEAPDAENNDKQALDVRQDDVVADWYDSTDDDGNIIHVAWLQGTFEFVIHEGKDEDGLPVYTSSMFKNAQDDQQAAFSRAFQNVGLRAFRKKWNVLFPPEERKRAEREKQAEKIARLTNSAEAEKQRADIAELQAQVLAQALAAGVAPDFEAAGVPVPEYWVAAMAATTKSKK